MQESISQALGEVFTDILNRLRGEMREGLADLPLSLGPPDIGLLGFLARYPGSTARELCDYLGRDKAQMARKLKQLEGAGLLGKEADAHDRRRTHLFLTPEGEGVANRGQQVRQQAFARLLVGLDAREQEQLLALLMKAAGKTDIK